MARDLAGLDSAAAHLLPERDIGAAERVEAEAGKIEARIVLGRVVGFGGARRQLQRLPDA